MTMRVVQDMRNHVHPSMRGVVKRATAFVSLALSGEKRQSDPACVPVSVYPRSPAVRSRLGGWDVVAPDGRGVRYNPDCSFRGFLEPKK